MTIFFNFIRQCRDWLALRWLYWFTRGGMGLAFILSGIRKLPTVKFTQIPMYDSDGVENLVGLYFHAMYQTGFYWNFIGYVQITLGISLFFNRFAPLVLVMMMPITINICLVSFALQMQGTPLITTLMVLGNLFLLLWHFEAYLPLLQKAEHTQLKRLNKRPT